MILLSPGIEQYESITEGMLAGKYRCFLKFILKDLRLYNSGNKDEDRSHNLKKYKWILRHPKIKDNDVLRICN